MPLFEFFCPDCQTSFEEICKDRAQIPACPNCASKRSQKQICAPSPLKKGAFPFKPGPVHPLASRMASGNACHSCPSSSSCTTEN